MAFKGWNTDLICQAIEILSTYCEKDLDQLLESAGAEAQRNVHGAWLREQALDEELDRMIWKCFLPEDKMLEKIARYEAHMSRQMHQALHELEALQTR